MSDIVVIAKTRAEMQEAQGKLSVWVRERIHAAIDEAKESRQRVAIARKGKWAVAHLVRQLKQRLKLVVYYRKIELALALGYHIVPNFPIDHFAIRTTRVRPNPQESTWEDSGREQNAMKLTQGKGRYVDSRPAIAKRYRDDPEGSNKRIAHYFAKHFCKPEFPYAVVKPEIMLGTDRAMQAKVFDAIGVCPPTNRGDPMVIGRIWHPDGQTWNRGRCISFLVTWWIDTAQL